MREPRAPEHESVDADLARDFAARKERAEILMCRLDAARHDYAIRRAGKSDFPPLTEIEP